ncbi:TonB-dependent receptor [Mucilaginibacter sp. BT774]|uniref:SusC/RagA family TonB-linked outer membrane protein n=1 Tax=Mucilaginibacter sp. BT774 TaxID=3062276 RepID=UPI0026767AF1|nr:TonB-dependent receptor [Mucilaginibacter sp. BT774]MDO3626208.1 TonB-dependent receptor [Mucilaginibacter sp. BT774]
MQKFTNLFLRRTTFILMVFFTICFSAAAQTSTVTGVVTAKEDNTPIPGVTVTIKNTKQGLATDANGKFSLNVPAGAVLVFNLVGYEPTEVPVNGPVVNASLTARQNNLNEVVVIGYGTVKKKDLTGAVANIKGADIKSQGVSDVTKALQGKLPGVTIEAAGGNPGSGTRILIRGVGSLNNATPLYLVDGVQVANINNLSQNDIQSIDILKDASAAAIYGSRAANGVVLVTTKSGKSGQTVIQANANYGVQNIAHRVDVLDAEQWATVSNAAHDAAGLARLSIAQNPQSLGAGTNWQDAIYRSAPIQQYDLLLSGGNPSTNYSVSGSFLDQDGIVKVTGYNRYNLRAKSETSKGPFKFGETIILTREKTISMPGGWGGQGGNPVGSAAKMIPVFGIYDPTAVGGFAGATGPVVNVANPLAQLNLEDINRISSNILTNAYGQLTILPGLTYKLNFGYTSNFGTGTDYYKRYVVGTLFSHPTNDLSISKDQTNLLLVENTLNYTKQFGKHSIQALAGYTYQKNDYSYLLSARTDLPDGLENIDAGAGTSTTGGNSVESTLLSALGRVIYSYDDRYLMTASFRRDGSSRFGSNNRYGNFPSVALGWNTSNEKFYGSSLKDVLSTFKLRASYGVLGNQEIGDYQYSAAVASNINYVTGTTQQKWFGAIQTSFADPNIKWENTKTVNAGFDAGFFRDKLFLTADYFIKTTDDVLLNVPIPGSAGSTSNPVVNAGSLRNKGIELGVNYTDQIGKVKYSIFGTFSAVKNKVLQLGTGTQQIFGGQPTHHGASSTMTEAGGPITGFYLIKDIGIFQSQAEVDAYKDKNGNVIQPNAHPGDIKFLDANGDGQITAEDKVYLGSPFPNFEYGFGFNASYRNFDINAFFQGTHGNKIYNGLRQDLESMSLEFNYSATTLKAWTPQNTNTTVPRAVTNDPNFNDQTSSRFLESGSYMRLKTLQIGYTLDDNLKRKLKVSSLRIYVSGDNVFTITKYTGFNPDLGRTGSIFDRGVDFGHVAYPLARTFSVGLQLGL